MSSHNDIRPYTDNSPMPSYGPQSNPPGFCHSSLSCDAAMTGYLHPQYAWSLAEFGEPVKLPRSGGWLLKRPINSVLADAMGTYPLFVCSDWKSLNNDLDDISRSVVSIIVVTDPYGEYDESVLRSSFDFVKPFKPHFVHDLALAGGHVSCDHHARNVRVGRREVDTEYCEHPSSFLGDWIALYSGLIRRHRIAGIRAFSATSFALQLSTPGIVCFRAVRGDQTVGMVLWYLQHGIAYYHLAAYSDVGYQRRASYALFSEAFQYFSKCGVRYIHLGAGAGLKDSEDDGLSRFKRGWSTGTRHTYLCGRVCDRAQYDLLVLHRGIDSSDYFPAYRDGEFT